jgi:curved DNA-binding protein CbpA
MSHYDTLGIKPDADPDTIKAAYRRLASGHHPDRGGKTDQMALINRAHEVLIDPQARKRYDETGQDTPDKPVQEKARDLLIHAFSMVLDDTWDHDMIGKVRAMLQNALLQIESETKKVKFQIEKVTKRRSKVRAKVGHNLFNDLCLQRISELSRKLPELDQHLMTHELALSMLDDYECDVEIAPAAAFFTGGFINTSGR